MANILKKANEIVNERSEEKERQYGPFQASMIRAAALYNLMSPIGQRITAADMYRAMIALKLSREAYAHKEDNLLDAVAYIGSMNDYLEKHKALSTIDECLKKRPCHCDGCSHFDEIDRKCNLDYKINNFNYGKSL